MKRRSFLSMMGAAGLVPAMPALAQPAPVAAGYNRYMYGLAVFHARTRATVSVADLMTRLKVGSGPAEAMIGEMTAKGVIKPTLQSAGGLMRVIDPHHRSSKIDVRSAVRRTAEWLQDDQDKAIMTDEEDAAGASANAREIDHGKV
jgi:hypothetical protein